MTLPFMLYSSLKKGTITKIQLKLEIKLNKDYVYR